MTTLIVLITFLGFFMFYNTSKKAALQPSSVFEKWLQNNAFKAKYLGGAMLALALALSVVYFGTGSGIFAFSVVLMTVASLVILMVPLKYMNYKLLTFLFLVFLTLELIIG